MGGLWMIAQGLPRWWLRRLNPGGIGVLATVDVDDLDGVLEVYLHRLIFVPDPISSWSNR